MHKDIEEIILTEKQIMEICEDLGKQITKDYKDSNLLVVGLLKGCNPFMADLLKRIDLPLHVDYMDVSSYHGGTFSAGELHIVKDLETSVKGRDVLIAEDIVDSGVTINTVVEMLLYREAKSVEVVTLLDKPEGRTKVYTPKYVGKTIPKLFVLGYGLDYQEYYRNLPYVGVLKKSVYSKGDE